MKKISILSTIGAIATCTFFSLTPLFSLNIHAKQGNVIEVGKDGIDTISQAIKEASEGDTIKIPKGKYEEHIVITKNNLTLSAEEGTVIDGSKFNLSDKNVNTLTEEFLEETKNDHKKSEDEKWEEAWSKATSMVYIRANDVTVSGLEITNFQLPEASSDIVPKGIFVDSGSNTITIKNCKIYEMGIKKYKDIQDKDLKFNAHGILVKATTEKSISDITIKKCELYNLKCGNSESLAINGNVSNFEVSGNYIHDCDNIGIDAIGYENSLEDEDDRARNGRIFENKVINISSSKNATYDYEPCAGGIYVDGGKDIDIFDNYVEGCDIGIEVATEHPQKVVTNIKVTNNTLVKNNKSAGIVLGGSDPDDNGQAKDCVFAHNTVYNTENACITIQYARDINNVFTKNLFIAEKDAEVYYEAAKGEDDYIDYEAYGNPVSFMDSDGNTVDIINSINKNMATEDLPEQFKDNDTFSLKKISVDSEKGEISVTANKDLTGYGSAKTKLNK